MEAYKILTLAALIGAFCAIYGGAFLYLRFGWFKKLYHDLLDWHMPEKDGKQTFDGASLHATCRHCGKEILQDSQGNWF